MKCIACGKENVQNALFCAFCGARMTSESPAEEKAPEQEAPAASASRQTARPLNANPYMPPRPPVIPPAKPEAKTEEAEPASAEVPLPSKTASGPRQIIKPPAKRVFLFDEEQEEEDARKAASRKSDPEPEYDDDYDEFAEYEDDDEDEDLYEEDDEPRGGKIFVSIISVLTVILLIVGIISFMYGTTVGHRLRASVGLSSKAEDYILLADWQLDQHSLSDASASYYNAFKLEQKNYDLALTVGEGFENCADYLRAEQLYTFMIENYPQADEPYDRLMALLIRQGKTAQYESLLLYRAEHQPGYNPPTAPIPSAPTGSHQGGAYAGSVTLTLSAESGEIRYTLDGTTPGLSSLLYTGPITLTRGTHSIRAVAVQNGQISAEWTASFVIS
ncbi:MAG: chitobiase/beta-hexosaminidase C-terminal domain-containing protein [Clostridia bacterium]|nr:chitobiase/beta-hexosaminidase C-terminal domain-containing protein [Clostridia bacterium]